MNPKINWKQVLVSLAAGVFIGMAISICSAVFLHGVLPGRWHGPFNGEKRYTWVLDHFSRKLNLTPDQRTKVAVILEDKRQKMKTLRAEIRPRFEEIRTSTKEEIRKLLTPEQLEKFKVMETRWESRWAKRQAWMDQ